MTIQYNAEIPGCLVCQVFVNKLRVSITENGCNFGAKIFHLYGNEMSSRSQPA